jgi:hypothetical protein
MIPLFWRSEYANPIGGDAQIAGFGTNGEINLSICSSVVRRSVGVVESYISRAFDNTKQRLSLLVMRKF